MAGIFRPLKKNLTNPMFDPASASGPENTMPASLVQAVQAAPSVPLSDPQKSAQIQRVRPSSPDMSQSVTTPGVIEANNAARGVIDTSGGIGLRQIVDAGKVAVNGAVGAFRRGAAIVANPSDQFAKEREQIASEQLHPESAVVAAPAATPSIRPAAIPPQATPVVAATTPPATGDAMLPGALRPGSAAGLRPGEARFFDPRTGTNSQIDTNAPASAQGPAAWDQAGIDAAKNDPARQVHFVPRGPETRAANVSGPTFNLRPRKATELAQVQGQAANTVAETQGKSAVEVAKQNTVTAVEQAKATEADKTRRANEALQGKQVEAQGRVDAAKASKADVAPGAAKQSDAALASIDTEINGTVSGKTVVPGIIGKIDTLKKKLWLNAGEKKQLADLTSALDTKTKERDAIRARMTGGAPTEAPETSGSPNQAHIDLLLKNPAMAKDFDAKFGAGAAAKYLTKKG